MNKIFIILGITICVMIGLVWKSNLDRNAREEAFALQTEQYKQKMSQLEAENQARLAQEAKDKAQKEQARIEYNEKVKIESEKQEPGLNQSELVENNQEKIVQKTNSIEEKARKNLFDPEAAKFRNIQGNCGEINAKNRMGGYTGYRRFIYNSETDTVSIEEDSDGLYNSKIMDILWKKSCT
ncbi:hypothetical protein [Acinetobacter modestus]|uniref:hypothetical protein n=1 Tax=Acinetobacter modestus TaxID=1776740 RepID=UPI001F4A8EA2|nr:hypothetical protein [Acinetobacter modestus]